MGWEDKVALTCARVGLMCRGGSHTPQEAIMITAPLRDWVLETSSGDEQLFRLGCVELALDHRVGNSTVEKILDVSRAIFMSSRATRPEIKATPQVLPSSPASPPESKTLTPVAASPKPKGKIKK